MSNTAWAEILPPRGRIPCWNLPYADDGGPFVKGIGRWTAEMYLMFSMGRLDVFPVDDGSIRTAMRRVYRIPQAGFVAGARKKAQRWRPFRSVASWYLYRYLDLRRGDG